MIYPGLVKAGLAALAISGSVALWSLPAEAGASTGTWRNGMVVGPYGPGYYNPYGRYHGNGRAYRRRGHAPEYYRGPRSYGGYYEDEDAYYARPRVYRRGPPDWRDTPWEERRSN